MVLGEFEVRVMGVLKIKCFINLEKIRSMIANFNSIYKIDIFKIIFLSLLSFLLILKWDSISNSFYFEEFNQFFDNFTGKITVYISKIFDSEFLYSFDTKLLHYNSNSIQLQLPYNSYKYFLIAFLFLFMLPVKEWKSILLVVILVLLLVSFRAALIGLIDLKYFGIFKHDFRKVFIVWLEPSINIAVFVIFASILYYNSLLKNVLNLINTRISNSFNTNLILIIFLLIVIPPLPRVLISVFFPDLIDFFVKAVLNCSVLTLNIFGYDAKTSGKFIMLDSNWVALEYSCLGIGVFTMMLLILFSHKNSILNKIVYSFVFFIFYNAINSIRLAGLLLYLNNISQLRKDGMYYLHDFVSSIMYIFAYLGLFLYLFWFSNLKLLKNK